MTEPSKDAKYVITKEEIGRIRSVVIEDATHPYETGMINRILSRPISESCDDTCIYKRFSKNMKNAEKHDEVVRAEEREKVLTLLFDSCECIPLKEYASDYDKGFHQAMTLVRGWINQRKGAP